MDRHDKKRDEENIMNSIKTSFIQLGFIEERFLLASGQELDTRIKYGDRFNNLYGLLTHHWDQLTFDDRLLSDIYWASNYVQTDYKLLSSYNDKLEGEAKFYVNAIVTDIHNLPQYITYESFAEDDLVALKEKFRNIFVNASSLSREYGSRISF